MKSREEEFNKIEKELIDLLNKYLADYNAYRTIRRGLDDIYEIIVCLEKNVRDLEKEKEDRDEYNELLRYRRRKRLENE